MKIFIQVIDHDIGSSGWWNDDGHETYVIEGKDLWRRDSFFYDYCRGTAFTSVRKAKKAGREAKNYILGEGWVDVEIRYWHEVAGELVRVKFTRDNKMKK